MKIGIIGTQWGLMHVGAFRGAGAEVFALCGRDPSKTARIAERENIPVATTDVAELVHRCDAVVVASPDAQHGVHVLQALDAGRPVLCEKPLTRTVGDAERLLHRSRQPLAPVTAVGFPYRALPSFSVLHGWLSQRPPLCRLSVSLTSSYIDPTDGSAQGPMMAASGDFGGASHVLDAALWLSRAEPVSVQASLRGRPAHSLGLLVRLDSGAVVQISHTPGNEPGIYGVWRLGGEGWDIELGAGYLPTLHGWRLGTVRLVEQGRPRELFWEQLPRAGEREPWAQAHVENARAFLSAIAGGDRGALATFADGTRAQRVFEAAMMSELTGARIGL